MLHPMLDLSKNPCFRYPWMWWQLPLYKWTKPLILATLEQYQALGEHLSMPLSWWRQRTLAELQCLALDYADCRPARGRRERVVLYGLCRSLLAGPRVDLAIHAAAISESTGEERFALANGDRLRVSYRGMPTLNGPDFAAHTAAVAARLDLGI